MFRPIFYDNTLQTQYEKEGYVIVKIFENEDIEELLDYYVKLDNQRKDPFFVTLHYFDSELKKKVDFFLKKSLESRLDRILIKYKPIFGSYAVKLSSKESIVKAHQDYSFVDEDKYDSLNVWFPITKTTFHNGSLHVYPGSHKWPKTIRGCNTSSSLELIQDELGINFLKELFVPIGYAVIYSHRLIHASPPNLSNEPRIAAAMAYIPGEADLIHYELVGDKLNVHSIDSSFFYDWTHAPNMKVLFPSRFKIKETLSFTPTNFTKKTLYDQMSAWERIKCTFRKLKRN